MEPTREERQQMRQRGAGTRKAKEVNFGFSFGSPLAQQPAPAPLAIVPEPQKAPQIQPATAKTTTPPPSLKSPQPISQEPANARTPGSARNKLPERPSTYDLPSDDRGEQTRSNKRRKLSPQKTIEGTPSRSSGVRSENGDRSVDGSSNTTGAQTSHTPDVLPPTLPERTENPGSEPSNHPASPIPETSIGDPHQRDEEPEANGSNAATAQAPTTTQEKSIQSQSPANGPPETAAVEEAQAPLPSPTAVQPLAELDATQVENRSSAERQQRSSAPEDNQRTKRTKKTASPVAESPADSIVQNAQRESSAEALPIRGPSVDQDVEMSESAPQLQDKVIEGGNEPSLEPSTKTKKPRGRPARKSTASQSPEVPAEAPTQEPVTEIQAEPVVAQVETALKSKRPRGRPSLGKKTTNVSETDHTPSETEPAVTEPLPAPRRGRKPASAKPDRQQEPVVEPAPPKLQRGRPAKQPKRAVEPEEPHAEDPAEPEAENAAAPSKPKRGRASKKNKDAVEPEPEPAAAAAAADSPTSELEPPAPKAGRGRPGKAKRAAQPEPEPEPEPELEPEHEAEPEEPTPEAEPPAPKSGRGRPGKAKRAAQPEPEADPEHEAEPEEPAPEVEAPAPKSGRGRPGKKPKRATQAEAEPENEAEPEAELAPEDNPVQDQPRRKAREPRGETVPVTVYRLTNVNSLGDTVPPAEGQGEDQDSADELTTNQRTKIPSRGGVNPADVLSQICRETLEKTLNALKDGISNEANATRRAEWSRKRKAVETFGSELESRLMDLSGMLDSNFGLGVQLKKAKREMMDLRGHLYRVRRERENVALQMDAVRSKHIEEEKAKTSRNTINNSLHSLELALDRNQQRPAPATDSPADLEFMLRSVADVSARAPGAQGGLLNQIRSFNAQLEATASRLER